MASTSATATATMIAAAAVAVIARIGICRGGDRQRGSARSENNPRQHGNSPFEPEKRLFRRTVPSSQRLELAG
jgi:hypothetical protein